MGSFYKACVWFRIARLRETCLVLFVFFDPERTATPLCREKLNGTWKSLAVIIEAVLSSSQRLTAILYVVLSLIKLLTKKIPVWRHPYLRPLSFSSNVSICLVERKDLNSIHWTIRTRLKKAWFVLGLQWVRFNRNTLDCAILQSLLHCRGIRRKWIENYEPL